ncbi:hypothetical protein GCM10010349_73500 [Streptomyces flavofungini]|nr:hypothetical protein GCM10010349_73500 [Streptomyces flavofungini]
MVGWRVHRAAPARRLLVLLSEFRLRVLRRRILRGLTHRYGSFLGRFLQLGPDLRGARTTTARGGPPKAVQFIGMPGVLRSAIPHMGSEVCRHLPDSRGGMRWASRRITSSKTSAALQMPRTVTWRRPVAAWEQEVPSSTNAR